MGATGEQKGRWTLVFSGLASLIQQRAGKLTEFSSCLDQPQLPLWFQLPYYFPLSPCFSALGTSLCCRNGPASGCFVAVTYGLFEQSRAGLKCPTSREREWRERKKNAEKGNWTWEGSRTPMTMVDFSFFCHN